MSNFKKFVADLEGMNFDVNANAISLAEQYVVDSVFGNVNKFIQQNNMIHADQFSSVENLDSSIPSLNKAVGINVGADAIIDLCRACGVPARHMKSAIESVGLCINNYSEGYSSGRHFADSAPSNKISVMSWDGMYSDRIAGNISVEHKAAIESFGADVTNTISDARVAITVSILRYHRGILHRLIPNIPTDSTQVMYKVDNIETYDLAKSRGATAAERYDGDHRLSFVELYTNPSSANTKLKPIVLRTANDAASPNNKLLAENVVKIGTRISMFDYSIDATQIGYQHIDYTDLVADNVRIKALYISVTDGTDTEIIPVTVSDYAGARMVMSSNNMDSSDRSCVFSDIIPVGNAAKQMSGAASVLLAGLTDDAVVKLRVDASGSVNLKNSEYIVLGTLTASIATISGVSVVVADQTIFDGLTFAVVASEPAAEFSEENVRKTTKAMRIMSNQIAYEIPGSQNYMVQYSLNQTRPEAVIDGLAKYMNIGNDDRGLNLILDAMANVHDRILAESKLVGENYTRKIGKVFVAGQRVNPSIYIDTLTIDSTIANMRSADKWGDMRAVAEEFILNVLSRLYRESCYLQELGEGEKPVFNCLTSVPIKNSLLSVPHYHRHLEDPNGGKTDDGVIEFRRVMPDGTTLNVITTNFSYMDDKLLMVPVRPSRPESVLNFAHNCERGQFLAQATPTVNDAIFNAIIANSREIPIVTNPVGALITVSGLHSIFDTFGSLG